MNPTDILINFSWRFATKIFDTSKKLSPDQLSFVKESLKLAPSSFGLEPYKPVIITDPQLREKLKVAAWGQPQITDASQLIVLASYRSLDEEYVNKFISRMAEVREQGIESLEEYKKTLINFVKGSTPEALSAWASKQAYIALGFLLSACAVSKIDACPMEGFSKSDFDKILELDKYNLKSDVLCAVGFRSDSDKLATKKKVRFDDKDFFIEL